MLLSVIDIGTNTILMVTLEIGNNGEVSVLGDEHEIARLGKGVDASRRILPATFDRVAGYLVRYRAIAEGYGAGHVFAFGTSALRDAANREEFIEAMRERTGIAIDLLSGTEEAELTYSGALFGLGLHDRETAVLDIGGGSTEVAIGDGVTVARSLSLDVGAVRITERFFAELPPAREAIEGARAWVREMLSGAIDLPRGVTMVGVAGTVTTLGAIEAGLESFNADALNRTRLTRAAIAAITDRLLAMPLDAIRGIRQVHPDRADILPGGALILDEVMRRYDLPEIIVSTRGVRYGAALRKYAPMIAPPP